MKQPRNPWSDGPEYITQCPIQPGATFNQKIIFTTEEGTLWWHAHSDWLRATVHGSIEIFPMKGTTYPFPKPHREFPIILGLNIYIYLINIFFEVFCFFVFIDHKICICRRMVEE